MSFGLLKHFKDLKKDKLDNAPVPHIKHVVVGHDLGAILKLVELKKKYPEEAAKLISFRPVTRRSLLESYEYNVAMLRSSQAVEGVYKKHYNAKIFPLKSESSFYKDGKFHDFGGRAKSMEVLPGEEFFISKGYKLDLSSLFETEDWDNLDSLLRECQDIRIFESIEKTEPTDLVDKTEWLLVFKDFSKLSCENLYLSISPKKFLSFLNHKEGLTKELIDFASSVKTQAAISVSWHLDKELYPEEKTLFIPQSMTHEWGHFIMEFEPYSYQEKTQKCHALFLIHEEEPQSEDLASKIKLMKRVLDRVFPDIEKHITKEFIRFDEEMFISDIKEEALEQVGFDYPQLKFLGQTAQVPPEHTQQKYIARTLLNQ